MLGIYGVEVRQVHIVDDTIGVMCCECWAWRSGGIYVRDIQTGWALL